MNDTVYYSCAETAKLTHQALKKAFPGVKFGVRSKTYSGGASIDVHWTDGPAHAAVDEVAGFFAGATFDGMVDLKSYVRSQFEGKEAHFGSDYVFCNRHISDDYEAKLTAAIEALANHDRHRLIYDEAHLTADYSWDNERDRPIIIRNVAERLAA